MGIDRGNSRGTMRGPACFGRTVRLIGSAGSKRLQVRNEIALDALGDDAPRHPQAQLRLTAKEVLDSNPAISIVLPEHKLDLGLLVGGKLRGHGHGIPGILTRLPTPKGAC
jgi:hypothetical protein